MSWHRSEQFLEQYQVKAEPPLLAAAVLFCAVYAWPIIDPTLGQPWRGICLSLQGVIWLVFVADYAFKVAIAPHRLQFVRKNLLDIIIIVLPMFRPLRLLRLMFLLRFLDRRAGISFQGKVAWYVAGSATLIVFIGALAVLDAERFASEAVITDYPTAVWWAITTVTTVGYGDTYPVTTEGRGVAVALMLYGIGMLGTITGMLATWLVDKVDQADAERDERREQISHQQIEQLRGEVADLKKHIVSLTEVINSQQEK